MAAAGRRPGQPAASTPRSAQVATERSPRPAPPRGGARRGIRVLARRHLRGRLEPGHGQDGAVQRRGERCGVEEADAGHTGQHLDGAETAGGPVRVLGRGLNAMDRRGGVRGLGLPPDTNRYSDECKRDATGGMGLTCPNPGRQTPTLRGTRSGCGDDMVLHHTEALGLGPYGVSCPGGIRWGRRSRPPEQPSVPQHRTAAGGDPELAGPTEHAWRRVLGFAARAAAVTCARAGAEPPFAHELRGLA